MIIREKNKSGLYAKKKSNEDEYNTVETAKIKADYYINLLVWNYSMDVISDIHNVITWNLLPGV